MGDRREDHLTVRLVFFVIILLTPLDIQKLQKNHTLQTAKLEQEVHVDDDMNHKKPEARPTGDCDDAGVNQ